MADHSSPERKLEGKVAIITGGASGIGEETARQFAYHGAYVVIADVQDEKGHILVESIGPERCMYVSCDVTDEEQVKSLVESTVRARGRLDIMFSNAGVMSSSKQDVLNFDMKDYERLFAVNVKGMVASVKHGARAMVTGGGGGSIICTTSIVTSMGVDRYIDYCMSKHAVLGLVRSASKQLGESGVRVNCVSPGAVGTPLLCGVFGMGKEEVEAMFEPSSCMRGVLTARHVANAVVFLASDDSQFITGHNLVVDGGQRQS